MSASSIAAGLSAASAAQTRDALSGQFVKQNAEQAAAVANLVEQAGATAKAASKGGPPPGLGNVVDVSA